MHDTNDNYTHLQAICLGGQFTHVFLHTHQFFVIFPALFHLATIEINRFSNHNILSPFYFYSLWYGKVYTVTSNQLSVLRHWRTFDNINSPNFSAPDKIFAFKEQISARLRRFLFVSSHAGFSEDCLRCQVATYPAKRDTVLYRKAQGIYITKKS